MSRVLLVDDSAFICTAVGAALRAAGYDVDIANDLWAFEGEHDKPDLVIMDVVLQEAYGDEIAELLRATRGLTCPILLFSALSDSELANRAADAGLDGYITKREGLLALVKRVDALLGTHRDAPAPAAITAPFDVTARQRVRRVVHVLAQANQWSATAIAAEMQALSGDADLVGATAIADAARACRNAVVNQGSAGWTPVIGAAINVLGKLVDDKQARGSKVMLVTDGPLSLSLLPLLDAEGHVMFEARSLAEARQKLRATDYDVVVLDISVENNAGAQFVDEIRARKPIPKLLLIGQDMPRDSSAAQVSARITALLGA